MEGSNTLSSNTNGVTVVGSDAPSEYHLPPRPAAPESNPPESLKKKRGRPRKYASDGSSVAAVMSPKPISSSAPPPPPPSVIDFSAAVEKKPKARAVAYGAKVVQQQQQQQGRVEAESLSNGINDWVQCPSVGAGFTPHIISVNTGEDVMMKILSFGQQGTLAICILSANGIISSVTLRQPDSSGGTVTYEGRFEILSLTGSFVPSESGGMRNRSGGMSVSLAGPDGRVVGGGVAGLLVAASPVQIVIGSFPSGNQHEQTIKKQKLESTTTIPISSSATAGTVDDNVHPISSTTFQGESWSAMPQASRNNPADINVILFGS